MGLALYEDKILTYKVKDKVSDSSFYRLIGGHIEFGEYAEDALKREFYEEISQEIRVVKQLGVFENIFFYNGKDCHEFLSLFKIEFVDKNVYAMNEIVGIENSAPAFTANWVKTQEFKQDKKILYPTQAIDYI